MIAANKGHASCVRVLIAAKADLGYVDKFGTTALHYAAGKGHTSTCRILVYEGAPLKAVNGSGKTPLESAKEQKRTDCIALLEAVCASRLSNLLTSSSPLLFHVLEEEIKQFLSSEPTLALLLGSLRSALCVKEEVKEIEDKGEKKVALEVSQEAIDSLLDNLRITDPFLTLLDDLKDVREMVLNQAYADALSKGSRPLRRSRLMILGEGRAGKSSLLRALTGKPFEADLASTAGVSMSDCISVGEAGAVIGEYMRWHECDKNKLEVERTLLEQVASEARKPKKLQAKAKPTSRFASLAQVSPDDPR